MDCEMKEYDSTLGMATVPWQKWEKVMGAGCALQKGTIFEELDLPFYGVRAACDSNYTRTNHPQREERGYYNHDMRRNNMGRNNMGRGCGCR